MQLSLISIGLVVSSCVLLLANFSPSVDCIDIQESLQSPLNRTRSQNATKLQARISLESKILDIDDESEDVNSNKERLSLDGLPLTIPQNRTETLGNGTLSSDRVVRKLKKPRSSRRLSNIWSMFLPGSSGDSDYEESVDEGTDATGGGSNISGGETITASQQRPSAVKVTTSNSSETSVDRHNDRLVAKYGRPTRPEGGQSSNELLLSGLHTNDQENAASEDLASNADSRSPVVATSATTTTSASVSTTTKDDDLQPVRLITGAVSKDMSPFEPNMNDIVSNLMSSMSSTQPNANKQLNAGSVNSSEIEREEENKSSPVTNKTSTHDNSTFERWLNRIQFQESSSSKTQSGESTNKSAPLLPKTMSVDSKHQAANQLSDPKLVSLFASRWLQRNQLNGNLTNSSGSSASNSGAQMRQQQIRQVQPTASPSSSGSKGVQQAKRLLALQRLPHSSGGKDDQTIHRHQQHPFQQQMRHHQAQLIHGIKYPSAQASTISVSTQDGASNTSLSFAMLNSLGNEVSQVVNSTGNGSGSNSSSSASDVSNTGTSGDSGNLEQTAYQSQDEILRQVTSAINFEQQQLMAQRKPSSERPSNSIEDIPSTGGDGSSFGSDDDNASKLFKVGSSMNELSDPFRSLANGVQVNKTSNQSPMDRLIASAGDRSSEQSNSLSPENIDKSFDMLAEKLRQLAQQQQQLTNSSQPSWLRAPTNSNGMLDLGSIQAMPAPTSGSATNNTKSVGDSQTPAQFMANLERMKEIISKHEKTKNELKSSQESIAQLMKHLMQAESGSPDAKPSSSSGRLRNPSMGNQMTSMNSGDSSIPSDSGATQNHKEQQPPQDGSANFGWTPFQKPPQSQSAAQSARPASPANLIKNRVKSPMQKLPSIPLEGQVIFPSSNDDLHADNLALMFASSQAGGEDPNYPNAAHQQQQLIGLPIAILRDDEIEMSRAQLEATAAATAEELASHKRHLMRQSQQQAERLEVSPQPILNRHHYNSQKLNLDRMQQKPHFPMQQHQPNFPPEITQGAPFAVSGSPHFHQQAPFAAIATRSPQPKVDPVAQQRQSIQNAMNSLALNQMSSLINEPNQLEQQQNEHLKMQGPVAASQQAGGDPNSHDMMSSAVPNEMHNAEPMVGANQNQFPTSDNQRQRLSPQLEGQRASLNPQQSQAASADEKQEYNRPNVNTEQNNNDFRLMKLAQQQQQQQVSAPRPQQQQTVGQQQQPQQMNLVQSSYANANRLPGFPVRQAFLHDLSPQLAASPMRGPLVTTTTVTGGGPPVRLREMSLYKPFGFQSHHAMAYQPSPVLASIFPSLSQPRPSVLRHMTPFRATINEGQRLLGPLLPPQINENLRGHYPPFDAHYHGPMSPMRPQFYRYDQLRRRSPPAHPGVDQWRSKFGKLQQSTAASKLKMRLVDPPTQVEAGQHLVEDEEGNQHIEEIKFIPLDGYNEANIDEEDMRLVQRHMRPYMNPVASIKTQQSESHLNRANRHPALGSPRNQRAKFSDLESITYSTQKKHQTNEMGTPTEVPCARPQESSTEQSPESTTTSTTRTTTIMTPTSTMIPTLFLSTTQNPSSTTQPPTSLRSTIASTTTQAEVRTR